MQPDCDVTDARRLLRVVARFDPRETGTFAWLEDYVTVEVQDYSPHKLAEMRLRRVGKPAEAETTALGPLLATAKDANAGTYRGPLP
jgi:hypothetical protein